MLILSPASTACSSIDTVGRLSARLPTRQDAVKPLSLTSRVIGRKPPWNDGDAQLDGAVQRVSWVEGMSVIWPLPRTSKVISKPIFRSAVGGCGRRPVKPLLLVWDRLEPGTNGIAAPSMRTTGGDPPRPFASLTPTRI